MEESDHSSSSAVEAVDESWELLHTLIESKDALGINETYEHWGPVEMARALSRINTEAQCVVFELLEADNASELIAHMSNAQASEIVELLEPQRAAIIIDEMESSEAADLLGDLDESSASEIMEAMEPEAAQDAQLLTQYEDDVAGGLMVTEYLAYPDTFTVGQLISDLRENATKYRGYKVQYAYVISKDEQLTGVVILRDLILADSSVGLNTIMRPSPVSILDSLNLSEVEEFFDTHSYIAVPVVAEEGKLLGVVTREAVEIAIGERADSVYLKTQGIVGGEELRSMPWHKRSGRRLSWLSVNIVLNIMAASIIAFYEDTLASVIALAVFLPIISDMSGCSGNQAVAVTMRELTLGLIRPIDYFYVWIQEVKVGVFNGIALGLLMGTLSWLWKDNVYLGLVVGGALAINTVVAVSLGGVIPLVLKRFKLDPALASGPILTTVTDMCGFFIVLSFASALLPHLT